MSAEFLGAVKMILDNASSNAVNPHFIKLFDLIEKSLDDAKVRPYQYSDVRNRIYVLLGMAQDSPDY